MRKTKVICTLGPAVDNEEKLRELCKYGMNAARMNFSHGTHESHKKMLDKFRKVRDELGLPIPVVLDTKGPEIRTGKFKNKTVELKEGQFVTLTADDVEGDENVIAISYEHLYKDVSVGGSILIDDGLVELNVKEIDGTNIKCVVINGGAVSDNKGINVPGAELRLPALTPKDVEDIIFGCENDYDFIAASFVRKASDVEEIRKLLKENGGEKIKIIAKIENKQGVENIDDIIKVSDSIMIARGDLGVEIQAEDVPYIQKQIIKKSIAQGKPVITATQMLDSMIRYPRPTRAEVSDVANAIYDGSSCTMLSGETASGKYPIEALKTMNRIAEKTESSIHYWKRFTNISNYMQPSITNAISHACCTTALDLEARAIVTVTQTGFTAQMISRFRPQCPIVAATPVKKVYLQLGLSWGVTPMMSEKVDSSDELVKLAVVKSLESGVVEFGDLVIITAGMPVGVSGSTNFMKVQHAVYNRLG